MIKQELGSYQKGMALGGETRRGWEHKDPSNCYWAGQSTKAKVSGGLLGFLVGVNALPAVVKKLDQLADMPSPAETGLVLAGTALITYLGIRAGEWIINYDRNKYQS